MILTFALVYLGGWVSTTLATLVASQRLADGPTTPLNKFCFSLLAGLVWPLMIVGVVELSSVAVCSTAMSRCGHSGVPDSWLNASNVDDVVVPLR